MQLQQSPYVLEEIIYRVRQKDKASFTYLYDCFASKVYGYVLDKIGKATEAEEIVVTVFTIVWDDIDNLKNKDTRFSIWLFNIAKTEVAKALTAREARQAKIDRVLTELLCSKNNNFYARSQPVSNNLVLN